MRTTSDPPPSATPNCSGLPSRAGDPQRAAIELLSRFSYERSLQAEPAMNDGAAKLIHRSVVIGAVTSKSAAGAPLFAPVWQYACFS